MERDDLFARTKTIDDFAFDNETVRVFDDMVSRSVPFYHEFQRASAELAADFAQDGTNVYDLGCSTGTTLLALDAEIKQEVRLIGIDNSPNMLEKARIKLGEHPFKHPFEIRHGELHSDMDLSNGSVVVMLLTLQFVRPLYRHSLIRRIFQGLDERGCLIIVEKVTLDDSHLNRLFIEHYYDLKRRNGYSDLEISRKREALENVLIPYRVEENRELLRSEGFRVCEEFFRWYNFVGMIALK